MSTMTKWERLHSSRTVSVKSLVSGLSKLKTIGTYPRSRSFSRKRSRTTIRPSVKRHEVRLAQVRPGEVCCDEVRPDVRVCLPPRVPGIHALLEDRDVLV